MAPTLIFRNSNDATLTPNTYAYRDHPRYWNVVTQSVCISIATICICMRMYTKFLITRAPGWEDYTCFVAWVGLVCYSILALEVDKLGSGVHFSQIAKEDLIKYSKLTNVSQILYAVFIFITKLSIFLLYLRVFAPSVKSKTYFFIQLLLWFNFCFYLANAVTKIFECTPRERIWNKNVEGTCIDINILILATAALNVASDFQILLLPIFCVSRLQMGWSRKLGVIAIFTAGLFGCVSSLMRLIDSVKNIGSNDKTYDWFPEFLWTTAEIASGIIASCLPALPSFFRQFFRKVATTLSEFSTKSSSGGGGFRKKVKDSNRSSSRTYRSHQRWSERHVAHLNATELTNWEQDDAPIFSGASYTTAGALSEGIMLDDTDHHVIMPVEPRRTASSKGILKTVEVDIESEPGDHR